jgi:hypothetical protein
LGFSTFYLPYLKQISNSKHQITSKFQIANSKPVRRTAQALAPREDLFFCLGV